MTTDTIKQLGAEFHRAADSLADTLGRLDNARLERLTFLRRRSKDGTARLATFKEEIRTLPEQIAKWDAEAERLESQTAEDLLRQALEPGRAEKPTEERGPVFGPEDHERCHYCKGLFLKPVEHHHTEEECAFLTSQAELGAVVLHPQPPGEVIEAPLTQPKPEPYRAGLPPERLRKVWAEWEDAEGDVVTFKGDRFSWSTWRQDNHGAVIEHFTASDRPALRPHGATWARVEAMADEAERVAAPKMLDLRTVRDDSNHTNPDVVMADADLFDAGESAATKAPLIRKGETFTVEREVSDHGKGPRVKVTREGQGQCYIAALQPAHVVPASPAPTLLDLTKLPPGTACEATADFALPECAHRIEQGERFRVVEVDAEDETFTVLISRGDECFWSGALVPARVVKEGGGQ